jgi:hypothetical protein
MKLLKGINYLSITITAVLIILFLVTLSDNPLYRTDVRFLRAIPNIATIPVLIIFSIIISIKNHQHKGVLLFALFLSLVSMVWIIDSIRLMHADWIPFFWVPLTSILAGTLYIKSLQSFPRQISKQDVISVFPKNKIVSGYISWAIKDHTWLVFPVLLAGSALLQVNDRLSDVCILLTALLCLYVNYKKSSRTERNKILWLFWGLISFTFLTVIRTILYFITVEFSQIVSLLMNALMMLILVFALVMSLFFSNAFDTGTLIRRTLVDGFIFIVIILIYNTIEHYLLHWLSVKLELSNALLSSLLSGILVLTFSPIHHQLMKFLKKRIKNHSADHAER